MVSARRKATPRPPLGGAVQTPAPSNQSGVTPDISLANWAVELLRRTESSDEGRGWMRLHELLRLAAKDPAVIASMSASRALALVTEVLGDATDEASAERAFDQLYRLMSMRGGGRPVQLDSRRAKRLKDAGRTQREIAAELGCSERQVRRLLAKKP